MHPELLQILSKKEVPISNEQLVQYLTGEMSDEESHELERNLEASSLGRDALEGLMLMRDKHRLQGYRTELQQGLYKLLQQDPPRNKRKTMLLNSSIWAWMVFVLLMALVAWVVIFYLKGN